MRLPKSRPARRRTPPPRLEQLEDRCVLNVVGPQNVVVLRTTFQDYDPDESRYSMADVEGMMDQINTLWQNTSYDTISISSQVSELFQLPDNRSEYIDDHGDGDLSEGGKFDKVLNDAIANSPAGIDWSNVQVVLVLMAETDASQFHRGQGTGSANLPMGPGGGVANVGAAIFSENPSDTDPAVWGRWSHEIGHAFQEAGPAHPSNYNSEFELMDSNMPGQTGVFEKQSTAGFPGWMPESKYFLVTPDTGGGNFNIWAEEYDPAVLPNLQAVKVEVTDNLYYLVSVRRRVLGDDLNAQFAGGIPDEGVLIERVEEGAEQWVVVKGPGGDRNQLWDVGGTYENEGDGVFIRILGKPDGDTWYVNVSYVRQDHQPDVMLNPWRSPPGNTWETTDIWVDSPVNGYGTYRYGSWDDGTGNLVPTGNGDDPALGQENRIYARVRNVGFANATNVEVTFQITDPPGLGISPETSFVTLGTVTSADFPQLGTIAPGDFADVYLRWTPDFAVPEADLAAGRFYFHTCLMVELNHVAGETVFGNQDGPEEQENISYFQAAEPEGGAPVMGGVIRLRNFDVFKPQFYNLSYQADLPPGWKVELNGGNFGVKLEPDEGKDIPFQIFPDGPAPIGGVYGVDVQASSLQLLVNKLDPTDVHPTYETLSGARAEVRVVAPTQLTAKAERSGRRIYVRGQLKGIVSPNGSPLNVEIATVDYMGHFRSTQVVSVDAKGMFEGYLPAGSIRYPQVDSIFDPNERVVALFAGTTELASAGTSRIPILSGPRPTVAVSGDRLIVTGTAIADALTVSSFVGPDAKPALRVEWKDTAEYLSEKVEMPRGAIKTAVMFGRGGGDTLDASRVSLPAELYGEGGNDRLMGGPRYDVLDGGPGNDVLAGGGGGDTYRFVGGSLGSDAITEAAGTDTDTLDFSRFSGAIALDLSSTLTQKVREAALSLQLSSSTGLENAIGSAFSDRISGNSRNNFIKGGAGSDVINGRAGNDILWGEAGLDTLIGDAGDDRLVGGIDGLIDALFGGLGRDSFFGGLRERRDFTALDYFFQTPL